MNKQSEKVLKKQVGRTRGDVWDRLYRLNRFMAKFRGRRLPTMALKSDSQCDQDRIDVSALRSLGDKNCP
jgi:hypothetical protein